MNSNNCKIKLGYGQGCLDLMVGVGAEVVFAEELSAAPAGEVERSIDHALGKSLDDFAGSKSASILVSDITRPAPSHLMLPPLIRRLKDLGISDLKIVFALGTHRRMTSVEERLLLRDCTSLPYMQHDPKNCISLGETRRGTPVEILDTVASSDLIVATGNIEYHYYAGYSGGAKAVLPGVSSERSVIKNHELMRDPNSITGRLDSPVRLDMEDAAKIAGLDFILNAVLNGKKEIVQSVAGDFISAHSVGAATVDRMYRRPVRQAEIVVTCAGGRPKDLNLFQAQKALDNAKNAALPGGSIILVAECCEGLGHPVFERWAKEATSAEECWERFGREYEFGGHKAAFLAKESMQHHLILVSALPKDRAEMCFFTPAATLEQALELARERQGRDARMLVMPHGNLTLAVAK
ncbi:MAG: nickel-dependent lactate racemase [Methanothrix sp.]|jgi:nickel-dependent lactate racemase|nr:nickel-dependent lactate racemase [Methanothrix sp.]